MSGSAAANFCLVPARVWKVAIASAPIHSICPRHRRSSLLREMRSESVAMTWNFRLELPELSTRTFIYRCSGHACCGSAAFVNSVPGQVNLLSRRIRPSPAGNIRFICAVLVGIVPAPDLLVVKLFHCPAADFQELGHSPDRIHGQAEAINLVLNGQFQRSVDVALFLVTADVQVLMVRATVGQAMDEPGISVEIENDRLIHGEERIKIAIGQAVGMFAAGLQLEKINHIHVADLEIRKSFAQHYN